MIIKIVAKRVRMKINYPVFILFLVHLLVLFAGCDAFKKKPLPQLIDYQRAYDITVPQPSGLDLTFAQDGFWTVSDENSTVYKLDKWGKVEKTFSVNGNDLEGITVVDELRLAVVLERSREIVLVDTSGNELGRTALKITGAQNNGLEGITYDAEQKILYVLNEKNPCLLITLDERLNEISRDTLEFIKDASGIYFDGINKLLWILSDESKLICKYDSEGKCHKEYRITIAQPEGITFDDSGKNLFLVSDRNNTLYVYKPE